MTTTHEESDKTRTPARTERAVLALGIGVAALLLASLMFPNAKASVPRAVVGPIILDEPVDTRLPSTP